MKGDFNNGMFIGIFVSVIIVLVIRKRMMRKKIYKYDERQELLRGRAYKASSMSMIYFVALLIFAEFLFDKIFLDHWTFGFLVIIVGATVNAVYSILNDAFFYVNMQKKRYMVFLSLCGLINLVIGILVAKKVGIIENGVLTFRSLNLFVALMMGIVFLAFAIKGNKDGKEVD